MILCVHCSSTDKHKGNFILNTFDIHLIYLPQIEPLTMFRYTFEYFFYHINNKQGARTTLLFVIEEVHYKTCGELIQYTHRATLSPCFISPLLCLQACWRCVHLSVWLHTQTLMFQLLQNDYVVILTVLFHCSLIALFPKYAVFFPLVSWSSMCSCVDFTVRKNYCMYFFG